jgi:hypothetical protein
MGRDSKMKRKHLGCVSIIKVERMNDIQFHQGNACSFVDEFLEILSIIIRRHALVDDSARFDDRLSLALQEVEGRVSGYFAPS